ncbi:MAG: hypothetical protein ACI4KA_00915 [Oscillospiraceae bacterium]
MAESDRTVLLRRGSFRCANPKAELCGAALAAALMLTVVVLILSFFSFGKFIDMLIDTMLVVSIVMLLAAAIARLMMGLGHECSYEARETEFEVRGPKLRREIFYYSDVNAVSYVQIRKGGRLRGYLVTIRTGVRTIEYRYMFSPTAELLDTENTPFYYLEVNSGLRGETKLTVNADAVLSQFESMQRSQKKKHKGARNEVLADFFEGIDKSAKR